MGDIKQLKWSEIAQHQNPRWLPVAILDFQNAVTFEPLAVWAKFHMMEATVDRNPSEWPELVHHHDCAVAELLLFHLVAKAAWFSDYSSLLNDSALHITLEMLCSTLRTLNKSRLQICHISVQTLISMTIAMSLHKHMPIATGHQAVVDGQVSIGTPRITCSVATVATPRRCLVWEVQSTIWSSVLVVLDSKPNIHVYIALIYSSILLYSLATLNLVQPQSVNFTLQQQCHKVLRSLAINDWSNYSLRKRMTWSNTTLVYRVSMKPFKTPSP